MSVNGINSGDYNLNEMYKELNKKTCGVKANPSEAYKYFDGLLTGFKLGLATGERIEEPSIEKQANKTLEYLEKNLDRISGLLHPSIRGVRKGTSEKNKLATAREVFREYIEESKEPEPDYLSTSEEFMHSVIRICRSSDPFKLDEIYLEEFKKANKQ